jgi:hypothetical protein
MRITLDLNCGKDTCASEDNITGWLLRCEECKEAGK